MLEWKQDADGHWVLYCLGTSIAWIEESWDFEENKPVVEVSNIKDRDDGFATYKRYATLAGAKKEGMKQAKAWLEEVRQGLEAVR